jgi:2-aminoadipate transaminase
MTSPGDLPQGVASNTISLSLGHPDRQSLPVAELKAAALAAFESSQAHAMLEYGPERGSAQLADYLMSRLNREENLNITPDNLMIIAGATHGVDMVARLYTGSGKGILVEAPTYKDALHVFRDHEVDLHAVPMDENGVVVEALTERLELLRSEGRPPKLFYTIPNFHNPAGVTVPTERRKEVIDLSRRYGFIILEDDVYREIVFEGRVPPSYYALASGQGVLRVGSFSKTLAPGLRLGWLIGGPTHIEKCMCCGATQMGGGANPFASYIVAEYCNSGRWDSHIARLRQVYRDRRDVALAALERHMPSGVTWTAPKGGFFLWLTLPSGVTVEPLQAVVRQRGLLFSAGTGFFANQDDGKHHLRIAYSFAEADEMEEGIKVLAEAIADFAPG